VNTLENKQPHSALWVLAFRPFFLATASFAIIAIYLWWYQLQFGFWASDYFTPHWWHAHEMLMGFGLPVVIGFLLTAVQNWTGIKGTQGRLLQFMFACWLAARIILIAWEQHMIWALVAESCLILIAIIELCRRLWPKRQWKNLPLVFVLCLLGAVNVMSYQSAADPTASAQLHYALLWLFMLIISVIAGRIIPFFTARRLNIPQTNTLLWLDVLCLLLTLAIVIILLLGLPLSGYGCRGVLWAASFAHLFRWSRWQHSDVYRVPLLWSLHITYLLLPVSCLLLAINFDTNAVKSSIHLLSIGVMGGMILSMMARVSLGHTGRPIELRPVMSLAFILLIAAGLIRALLPTLAPSLTFLSWQLSAFAWIIAFTLFFYCYAPMLISPRPDGKPG
jgi:uncharacterized protein involved in response to NO